MTPAPGDWLAYRKDSMRFPPNDLRRPVNVLLTIGPLAWDCACFLTITPSG